MSRTLRPLVLALVLFGLPACSTTVTVSTEDDEIAVEKVRAKEVDAMNEGNTNAVLALCITDIVFMPTDQPQVSGQQAVREWLNGFFGHAAISISNTTESVTVSEDLAIEFWTALLTVDVGEGEPLTNRVKGIYVYRRSEDGTWKITRGIWNQNKADPRL